MPESGEQNVIIKHETRKPRRINKGLALGAAACVAVAGVKLNVLPDIGDFFKGGKSDPAPKGTVIYEGQEAKTASAHFLIEIGKGEATVSVKAKQDWDTPGAVHGVNPLDWDWQPTNGTVFARNPNDHDSPASMLVRTRYCADGSIEKTTTTDKATHETTQQAVFRLGELSVCGVDLPLTKHNAANFHQDDTPDDFNSDFVSFVTRAVEATAMAAPCPTDALNEYLTPVFNSYARNIVANQTGIPITNVRIESGHIVKSSETTKQELAKRLESFTTKTDPDNPNKKYEALSIQYLSGGGSAVEDSCYQDIGGVNIDTLQQLNPSAALNEAQH